MFCQDYYKTIFFLNKNGDKGNIFFLNLRVFMNLFSDKKTLTLLLNTL